MCVCVCVCVCLILNPVLEKKSSFMVYLFINKKAVLCSMMKHDSLECETIAPPWYNMSCIYFVQVLSKSIMNTIIKNQ